MSNRRPGVGEPRPWTSDDLAQAQEQATQPGADSEDGCRHSDAQGPRLEGLCPKKPLPGPYLTCAASPVLRRHQAEEVRLLGPRLPFGLLQTQDSLPARRLSRQQINQQISEDERPGRLAAVAKTFALDRLFPAVGEAQASLGGGCSAADTRFVEPVQESRLRQVPEASRLGEGHQELPVRPDDNRQIKSQLLPTDGRPPRRTTHPGEPNTSKTGDASTHLPGMHLGPS